jgi:hypothetical protein
MGNPEKATGLIQKNADTLVIETILGQYDPVDTDCDDTEIEYLSTMEIVERFSAITSLNKEFIADELAANGFMLKFIANEYKWIMKIKEYVDRH